ncbi:hypothetical protein [Vibrio cholerae]|uniref:hypothetical protein n=1 Tax=Vibrio cholerae TaxID=666 RepID=UPI0034E09FE0
MEVSKTELIPCDYDGVMVVLMNCHIFVYRCGVCYSVMACRPFQGGFQVCLLL